MKERGILTVFHYLSLHSSPFYAPKYDGGMLPQSDRYSDCLVRLPMFYDLPIEKVINAICTFVSGGPQDLCRDSRQVVTPR